MPAGPCPKSFFVTCSPLYPLIFFHGLRIIWLIRYSFPLPSDTDPQTHLLLQQNAKSGQQLLEENQRHHQRLEITHQNDTERNCHRVFKTSAYEKHKNINPDRVDGTCKWVLNHPQYGKWRDNSHHDLLWISADPGCGKSVLSKSLVDNELGNTETHTVCYFFFKDNEEQDGLSTALCALIHQLFTSQPRLIRHALPAWNRTEARLRQEVDELWRILVAAGTDSEAHSITCVLDALDECQDSDRDRLITMLSEFWMRNSSSVPQGGCLKFLITSRPYNDIRDSFQRALSTLPVIHLRGEDENDQIHQEIDLVIRLRVPEIVDVLEISPETKDRLESKLLAMEHRTYLWLYLAIEGIRSIYRDSLRPDEESIESLPSTVEGAYEKILERVTDRVRNTVYQVLQIVVGARRPLTVDEMAVALSVATTPHLETELDRNINKDHLERHIRQWCGLFVFINHSKIYLIHQTAKEFLLKSGSAKVMNPPSWKPCFSMEGVDLSMTVICVRYLARATHAEEEPQQGRSDQARSFADHSDHSDEIDEIDDSDDSVSLDGFCSYAAEYWCDHARNVQTKVEEFPMRLVRELYDTKSAKFQHWFKAMWRALRPWEDLPTMNEVRLAAFNGHSLLLQKLLIEGRDDVDIADQKGRTALMWASELGYEKVVQMLMDGGADVNAPGGYYGNALYAASGGGHDKVVQMLMDGGADVNTPGGEWGNALQAALYQGHDKVVKLLLEHSSQSS
jgi:hypothetical protein